MNSVWRRLCSFLGRYSQLLRERLLDQLLGRGALGAGVLQDGQPGRCRAVVRCSGARASCSAAARSRGPSPNASCRAFSPSPRDSRAQAVAVGSGMPVRLCATCSAGSGSKRTGWQRLAIVGSTCVGRSVRRMQHDVGRRLLERLEQRVGRLLDQRVGALEHEDPVAGLERRVRGGGHDRLVDVSAEHLVRAAGRDPGEVGVRAVLRPELRVLGVARAACQQLAGERPGGLALARARRPVQQVRVRGLVAQGGAEHGARRGDGRRARAPGKILGVC